MTVPDRPTRTAFHAKAVTLALNAKCGRRIGPGDIIEFIGLWHATLPEDADAAAAVCAFAATVFDDPVGAGEALLVFYDSRVDRAEIAAGRRVETVLADIMASAPPPPPPPPAPSTPLVRRGGADWMARKDCGID